VAVAPLAAELTDHHQAFTHRSTKMKQILAVLGAVVLVAGAARADIAPPKGQKRVALDHKITTEKEFPDYRFYTVIGGGGKGGGPKGNPEATARGVTEVKFDPKTPIEIKAAGRGAGIGRQGALVAVPKDARKNYESDEEYLAAIRLGKVEGAFRAKTNFDAITTVKDDDARTTVVMEWKVEKLDKDGFVLKFPDRGAPGTAPKDGKEGPEEEEAAYAPRGGAWVAGLAATLGLVFAGLWLVGRGRR
jgi:hypothetical protein